MLPLDEMDGAVALQRNCVLNVQVKSGAYTIVSEITHTHAHTHNEKQSQQRNNGQSVFGGCSEHNRHVINVCCEHICALVHSFHYPRWEHGRRMRALAFPNTQKHTRHQRTGRWTNEQTLSIVPISNCLVIFSPPLSISLQLTHSLIPFVVYCFVWCLTKQKIVRTYGSVDDLLLKESKLWSLLLWWWLLLLIFTKRKKKDF